jgi:hypothetical protein
MTPAQRRAATLLASLTLATAAVGGNVSAQSAAPTPGGTLVLGEWQGASQLNPFFSNAFADTEAYTVSWRAPLTIDNDGNWVGDLLSEVPSIDN